MRHYSYLFTRDKTHITQYVCYHCVILDKDTELCYHSTGREGYVCETLSELKETDDILVSRDFDSDKNIESFFIEYQLKNGRYGLVRNNCEDFANAFYGHVRSVQVRRAVFAVAGLGMMIYGLYINKV